MLRELLRFPNLLLILLGLSVVGYATYLAANSLLPFALFGLGGLLLLVGASGLYVIGGKTRLSLGRRCLVGLHVVLLLVLVLAQGLILVGLLFFKHEAVRWIRATDSSDSVDLENTLLDSTWPAISVGVLFALLLVTAILTIIYRKELADVVSENMVTENMANGQIQAQFEPLLIVVPQSTPITDSRRASLNVKYGGIFSKPS